MSQSDVSKKSLSIKDVSDRILAEQVSPEKQIEELESKCFKLNKIILDLKTLIQDRDAEISHLKKMLEGSSGILPVSDEEEIATIQLEKLKHASRERELTLPEIKIFDLLVKNKRLAQGEVTDIQGNKKILPKQVEKKDLIKLASPAKKVKDGPNKS